MHPKTFLLALAAAACIPLALSVVVLGADAASPSPLAIETVEFLQAHCLKCHQGERPKGKLDLSKFRKPTDHTAHKSSGK